MKRINQANFKFLLSQKEYLHLPGKKQAGGIYTGNIK
jgi:hypothetical protein